MQIECQWLKKNCSSLYDQINVCMNHSEQEKSAERDHSESAVSH
jgi:hypothetical protein